MYRVATFGVRDTVVILNTRVTCADVLTHEGVTTTATSAMLSGGMNATLSILKQQGVFADA
eukprot:gene15861-62267_t